MVPGSHKNHRPTSSSGLGTNPSCRAVPVAAATGVTAVRSGPNCGRPAGIAAESGVETHRPLAAFRQNRGRRAVPRTNSWLREKTAAENQGRECQYREPFPIADAEQDRRVVPRTGEYQQVGPDHCNPVERGRRHHRDSHVRADLDRAIHQQLGRDESECTREAHARQAREQEANRQRGF